MPLIVCIDCGKQFSDRALACPNCGCPVSECINSANAEIPENASQPPVELETEQKPEENPAPVNAVCLNSSTAQEKIITALKTNKSPVVFISPFNENNFNSKRLINACRIYGENINPQYVTAFIDTTIFGSGKEGYLFTADTMYYKEAFESPDKIRYNDIDSATFQTENGKDTTYIINITLKNGRKICKKSIVSKEMIPLTAVIRAITEERNAVKQPGMQDCSIQKTVNAGSAADKKTYSEESLKTTPAAVTDDVVQKAVPGTVVTTSGSQLVEEYNPGVQSNIIESSVIESDNTKYVSSEDLIKDKLEKYNSSNVYVAPFNEKNYSDKKLLNACQEYAEDVSATIVTGFIDTTLLGSGKEGFLFTGKSMYYKKSFGDPGKIEFEKIRDAVLIKEKYYDSNGNVCERSNLKIYPQNGDEYSIDFGSFGFNKLVADILHGVCVNVDIIDETAQLIQLKDLGDDVTALYLKIIMNYLKEDDDIIGSDEYKELISLMTRLKINSELSDKLREYRFEEGISEPTEDLISELRNSIPRGSLNTIMQALANDLLILRTDTKEDWKQNKDFVKYCGLLGVSDMQIDFFARKVKQDEKIFNERIDDSTIKKAANELAAVGGAAGVSLAALAVTGGVGTGIWGGLMSLAVASTGGMLFGLAAIAGAGYGVYKGIKYFSGTSELEKYGIRNEMLQAKIKEMQLSQNFLIDDINWTNNKIAALLSDKEKILQNFEKIQKLLRHNKNFKESSDKILSEEMRSQKEIFLSKIPQKLNTGKCDELLSKNKFGKEYKEFIYSFYEQNDENDYIVKDKDAVSYEEAEKLAEIIIQIGYYDTTQSVSAQVGSLKKSFKGLLGV